MKKIIPVFTLAFALTASVFCACKKESITPAGNSIQNHVAPSVAASNSSDLQNNCDGGASSICKIISIGGNPDSNDGGLDCKGEACDCNMVKCRLPALVNRPPKLVAALRKAIEEGKVKEFFSGNQWRGLLPEIARTPGAVDRLKSGEFTMVIREGKTTDFFFIVRRPVAPNKITISDVYTVWEFESAS